MQYRSNSEMVEDMRDEGDVNINGGKCLGDGVLLEKKDGYGLETGGQTHLKINYLPGLVC